MAQRTAPRRAKRGEDHCIFERAGRRFALPVTIARRVVPGGSVEPLPGLPSHVVGLLAVEEEKLPLIQIDPFIERQGRAYGVGDQILIVGRGDLRFALALDRVRAVQAIDLEQMEPPAPDDPIAGMLRGDRSDESGTVSLIEAERLLEKVGALRPLIQGWEPAAPEEAKQVRVEGEEFCIFDRGTRFLAVPVTAAREVLTGEVATPVPQAPRHLIGVLNLRGEILPLVQVDEWLGLPPKAFGLLDQVLVVESLDVQIGLIVDRVRDIRLIETADIQPIENGDPQRLFRGYWWSPGGLVSLLDTERLVEEAVSLAAQSFREMQSALGAVVQAPAASADSIQR
jgi:purine-binding chemotaxis protein CheW